eukprot:1754382-Rhodomonas_salina.2
MTRHALNASGDRAARDHDGEALALNVLRKTRAIGRTGSVTRGNKESDEEAEDFGGSGGLAEQVLL